MLSPQLNNNNLSLGLTLMFGAFFCFASMDTSAKWLVGTAIPALQVAFLRYFIHFLWTLVVYLPTEGRHIARSNKLKYQLVRSVLLLGGTAFNFTALVYLPLTVTIAMFFAVPMVVCLLSIPVLGEKVGIKRFAAVFVGFIGVLIIVEPWGESFDYHVLFALAALLSASGYFVMSRLIAGVDNNAVTQFYTAGVATVLLGPVAIYYWVWPATSLDWFLLVLLGSFGMLGHTMATRAHHYAEASVLAPAVYSQILYITLFSWLIFDAVPEGNTIVGTLVIVASGFYIWWRERKLSQ